MLISDGILSTSLIIVKPSNTDRHFILIILSVGIVFQGALQSIAVVYKQMFTRQVKLDSGKWLSARREQVEQIYRKYELVFFPCGEISVLIHVLSTFYGHMTVSKTLTKYDINMQSYLKGILNWFGITPVQTNSLF